MTAASNFFRRYTSTGQEGVAKQSIDQIEPVVEFKTLNETDPEHRATEYNRINSDFNDLDNTVIDMKSATTRKGESRPGASSKLPKPGKSRKNSRAPPPPQVGQQKGMGRRNRIPHDGVQRPCQTHSFHTDAAEVKHMEEGLLKLLNDFNSGKLRAFGQGCSMEQMEQIRDQQESLAKLHFDIGSKQDPFAPLSEEGLVTANDNMDKLMSRLERLSVAIGELNPAASAPTTPSSGFSKKSDKDEIS